METKHTKGEWKFTGETASFFGSIIGKNFKISINNPSNTEERIANAKLISSAPDLLNAAIMAKTHAEQYGMPSDIYDAITNAIKKATE